MGRELLGIGASSVQERPLTVRSPFSGGDEAGRYLKGYLCAAVKAESSGL